MTPQQQERYVRWQDYRITQLSFSINLFLGFAVASLAYAINLKLGPQPHSAIPLVTVILWWAAAQRAKSEAAQAETSPDWPHWLSGLSLFSALGRGPPCSGYS